MNAKQIFSQSKYVYYASTTGATLDSDVIHGGGTDDTEAIQAILDKAPVLGNLHFIMDGAALVRGITIHSNTTIECLNKNCGFFLADQSNRSIIRNANADSGKRIDKNISLLGGTYNHNCINQEHHVKFETDQPLAMNINSGRWVIGLEFLGIEHLNIKDITIRNQRTFAIIITNFYRVTMDNVNIELPEKMNEQNQDGIHIQGPGQYLTMTNIKGSAWDDFIALNFDDCTFGPGVTSGDVSDILIDGVMVDDAAQVIRILSQNARVDRLIIKNVIGTYRSFGFYINPWAHEWNILNDMDKIPGNYGNIIIDTIDLRQGEPNYKYTSPFLFRIGGKHESLTLKNINHYHPEDSRSIIQIEGKDGNMAEIDILVIDGMHIVENNEASAATCFIDVKGRINNFIVRDVEIIRPDSMNNLGCFIELNDKDANIETIFAHDIYAKNLNKLISIEKGTIGFLKTHNIYCKNVNDDIIINDEMK